jgi:transcriptional regulator NrdR family protein
MVMKKDDKKEMYDRQKLKKSLMLSFAKREFNNEKVENLLNSLENKRLSE